MFKKVPSHVAIIMDGNGRWAKLRKRPRFYGHVRGSFNLHRIVEGASDLGIQSLTLFAFSTENWSRPLDEVKILFKLLAKFVDREKNRLVKNNIIFKIIGERTLVDPYILQKVEDLEALTVSNTGLKLVFAFNYGGRAEIIRAMNSLIKQNHNLNNFNFTVTEADLENHLYLKEINNIDLVIRTGGQQRISNFLLWQIVYSELKFTQTLWPDFTKKEFESICKEYSTIERRFGQIEVSNFETNKALAAQNKLKSKLIDSNYDT